MYVTSIFEDCKGCLGVVVVWWRAIDHRWISLACAECARAALNLDIQRWIFSAESFSAESRQIQRRRAEFCDSALNVFIAKTHVIAKKPARSIFPRPPADLPDLPTRSCNARRPPNYRKHDSIGSRFTNHIAASHHHTETILTRLRSSGCFCSILCLFLGYTLHDKSL